ncbi:MAG: hypothetical protein LBE83_08335 [Propionibacteriaceae bacterium]|jgi:hypothetical protein|nr:hypothetical protein [Propionibacteriaceae bacterium]
MKALNSAADIAGWIREELTATPADVGVMTRVIARETDRWRAAHQAGEPVTALIAEPARTGDQRWDALLEGVVAYRCNQLGVPRPAWTNQTRLTVGWNPYEDHPSITMSPGWALLDTLETPAPILDKGVTFSYRNMELL